MDERDVIARSLPPPEDVPVDGHFAGKLTPSLRSELYGWSLLPLAALALAGVLALMLGLAHMPGVEKILSWTGQTFFQKLIVVHVTFAFVVWYLGVQGAMTAVATAQLGAGGSAFIGGVGVYGFALSFILLLIPALADLGEPSLNNYIPVLIHPLYFAGLALLAVSLALPGVS